MAVREGQTSRRDWKEAEVILLLPLPRAPQFKCVNFFNWPTDGNNASIYSIPVHIFKMLLLTQYEFCLGLI